MKFEFKSVKNARTVNDTDQKFCEFLDYENLFKWSKTQKLITASTI